MSFKKKEQTLLLVLLLDLISTVIKYALAFLTGSLSMWAEAFHSLSDVGTTTVSFFAVKLDKHKGELTDHSDKWELRASAAIGVMLLLVAWNVFSNFSFSNYSDVRYPLISALIIIFLMILSYVRYRFESGIGRETGSPVLKADAKHALTDMGISVLVLIAFSGEAMGFRIDSQIAVIIALSIAFVALRLIYGTYIMLSVRLEEQEPQKLLIDEKLVVFLRRLEKGFRGRVNTFSGIRSGTDWFKVLRRIAQSSLALLGIFYLCSGFYAVKTSEMAIVEVFGEPQNLEQPVGPGLHYVLPWPVSRVLKVNTGAVRRLQVGYETTKRGAYILWTNKHYLTEYPVLAGDYNFLDIAAHLHYRVKNIGDYLYSSEAAEGVLKRVTAEALRDSAGTREFFGILTKGRSSLEKELTRTIQKKADLLHLGIDVYWIYLKDLHPPVEVASAFEDVVSAQEDLETLIEEAQGYKKSELPRARGRSAYMKNQALGAKILRIRMAEGISDAFNGLIHKMTENRDITEFRLRYDSLAEALKDKEIVVYDQKMAEKPVDLYLGFPSGSKIGSGNIGE